VQENTYRCISAACGHAMPRVVNFCPYCGTPQQDGAVRPVAPVIHEVTAVPVAVDLEKTAVPPPPAAPPPAAPPPVPRPVAKPAAPPQRQPLHWAWWLVGLCVLGLAWIIARPAAPKFDARIDAAIALAQECKGKQAQSELIALRDTRATPAQLQRLQTALNTAAASCKRAAAKARTDAARRDVPAASGESARNLIDEAQRDISRGNYKGAVDKMDTCVSMVDAGNRECRALKARAERLYQGL
jgi:hypothetical protein